MSEKAPFEVYTHYYEDKYSMTFPEISGFKIPTIPLMIPKKITLIDEILLNPATIEPYDLHPLLKKFFEPIYDHKKIEFVGSQVYNGLMSRLVSFTRTESLYIEVQPLYFFDQWLIHYNADEEIYPDKSVRSLFDDQLVKEITNNIYPSIFPSGLGFDSLLMTMDGILIIPKRSGKVAIEQKKIAPSISGGLKWKFFDNEMRRGYYNQFKEELYEEYGAHLTPGSHIIVTGFEKNLPYFGHPNMYFFGILDSTSRNLITSKNFENESFELIKIVDKADFSKDKLRTIAKAFQEIPSLYKAKELSYQLVAAIWYFNKFVQSLK